MKKFTNDSINAVVLLLMQKYVCMFEGQKCYESPQCDNSADMMITGGIYCQAKWN